MFNPFKPVNEPTPLDAVIESLVSEMQGYDGHTDEYVTMAVNLKQLCEAKASYPKPERTMSPDGVAIIAANLVGILMILNYERANIVTSKALSFVIKPKS